MTKFFSTLPATELNHEQYEQDVAPSVLFGYESQTQDLLSVASNGALTEQSAGIYALSALEMQEVQGGLKVKWKKIRGPIRKVVNNYGPVVLGAVLAL